jgi:predicted Ser/Thr protein kinase
MSCPQCGAANDDSARQCHGCGGILATLRPGERVASRWEVLARLGSGGMGVVYKAHDRELDEVVALKVLRADLAHSEEMTRRFRSEIKLARRVRHPNVCAIHEYGQDGALRFIVMEFVEGVDLKRVLAGGAMPHDDALEVAAQIAGALHAIHQAGIVHRDLKPANVMLDARGRVRLMDFGIAKQFGPEHGSGLTATGHIVGTPEYMSPEQVRGDTLDVRSDVYSLGTMLFEAFTGRVPFRGQTAMATLYQTVHEPVPVEAIHAARVPPAATAVLLRTLAKAPAERYGSAADLERALLEARRPAAPAHEPRTVALVRSALALKPEPLMETTPLPATPVPAAVPTAVPVGATVERRPYAGPSPHQRAARAAAPAGGRGGVGVALLVCAAAVAGVLGWRYAPQLRGARTQQPAAADPGVTPVVAPPSAEPVAVEVSAPPSAAPPVVVATATPVAVAGAQLSPSPAAVDRPAAVPSAAAAPAAATPEPPRAEPSLDRAEELFAQGRFGSALAEAKAVLQREPGNAQAQQLAEDAEVELMVDKRLKEAREAMQGGDRELAIEKLKLGLAAKPTDARLLALWRELTRD